MWPIVIGDFSCNRVIQYWAKMAKQRANNQNNSIERPALFWFEQMNEWIETHWFVESFSLTDQHACLLVGVITNWEKKKRAEQMAISQYEVEQWFWVACKVAIASNTKFINFSILFLQPSTATNYKKLQMQTSECQNRKVFRYLPWVQQTWFIKEWPLRENSRNQFKANALTVKPLGIQIAVVVIVVVVEVAFTRSLSLVRTWRL